MARKTVVHEYFERLEHDFFDGVVEALIKGARGSGVTLTEAECDILLTKLPKHYRHSYPAEATFDSKNSPKWQDIAKHSFRGEDKGDGVEAAVAATMQRYGVKRQTVFDARRRWKEYFALQRSRAGSD